MVKIDLKELMAAGAHFGHKSSRWHPKMAEFIYGKRDGAHIIDLTKTEAELRVALEKLTEAAASGKKILFVGTKKQLKDITREAAESVEMPYMTERWVGGALTNAETVAKQIKKVKNLEKRMSTGELEAKYSKLEVQRFQEEIETLNTRYGGIKEMRERPAMLVISAADADKNAIKEANALRIPVVAIADTNVDPTTIDYPIPANDDSLKAVKLILSYVTEAIKDGLKKVEKAEPVVKITKASDMAAPKKATETDKKDA